MNVNKKVLYKFFFSLVSGVRNSLGNIAKP